eukprot:Rmarinus@m.1766
MTQCVSLRSILPAVTEEIERSLRYRRESDSESDREGRWSRSPGRSERSPGKLGSGASGSHEPRPPPGPSSDLSYSREAAFRRARRRLRQARAAREAGLPSDTYVDPRGVVHKGVATDPSVSLDGWLGSAHPPLRRDDYMLALSPHSTPAGRAGSHAPDAVLGALERGTLTNGVLPEASPAQSARGRLEGNNRSRTLADKEKQQKMWMEFLQDSEKSIKTRLDKLTTERRERLEKIGIQFAPRRQARQTMVAFGRSCPWIRKPPRRSEKPEGAMVLPQVTEHTKSPKHTEPTRAGYRGQTPPKARSLSSSPPAPHPPSNTAPSSAKAKRGRRQTDLSSIGARATSQAQNKKKQLTRLTMVTASTRQGGAAGASSSLEPHAKTPLKPIVAAELRITSSDPDKLGPPSPSTPDEDRLSTPGPLLTDEQYLVLEELLRRARGETPEGLGEESVEDALQQRAARVQEMGVRGLTDEANTLQGDGQHRTAGSVLYLGLQRFASDQKLDRAFHGIVQDIRHDRPYWSPDWKEYKIWRPPRLLAGEDAGAEPMSEGWEKVLYRCRQMYAHPSEKHRLRHVFKTYQDILVRCFYHWVNKSGLCYGFENCGRLQNLYVELPSNTLDPDDGSVLMSLSQLWRLFRTTHLVSSSMSIAHLNRLYHMARDHPPTQGYDVHHPLHAANLYEFVETLTRIADQKYMPTDPSAPLTTVSERLTLLIKNDIRANMYRDGVDKITKVMVARESQGFLSAHREKLHKVFLHFARTFQPLAQSAKKRRGGQNINQLRMAVAALAPGGRSQRDALGSVALAAAMRRKQGDLKGTRKMSVSITSDDDEDPFGMLLTQKNVENTMNWNGMVGMLEECELIEARFSLMQATNLGQSVLCNSDLIAGVNKNNFHHEITFDEFIEYVSRSGLTKQGYRGHNRVLVMDTLDTYFSDVIYFQARKRIAYKI